MMHDISESSNHKLGHLDKETERHIRKNERSEPKSKVPSVALTKNLKWGRTMLPNEQKHRVGTHNVTQQTKTQSGDAQCYQTNKNTEWGRTMLPNEQKHIFLDPSFHYYIDNCWYQVS